MKKLNEGSVKDTLRQRGSIYGDYKDGVNARGVVIKALADHYVQVNGVPMSQDQLVWVSDLVMKLVRASSNPTHDDSLHDLQGYANLIEKMYQEMEQ